MPDRPPRPSREPILSIHRVDITGRTIAWLLAGAASIWLFQRLWPVLILLLVTLILVGTLNPLVAGLERHGWGRGLAMAAVFTGLVVGLAAVAAIAAPVLVRQIIQILSEAPRYQSELVDWLRQHPGMRSAARALADVDLTRAAPDVGLWALGYSEDIISITGGAVTALFLAAYLIADRERVRAAAYASVPRRFHLRLSRILLNLEVIVGGYVRGQLITSVLIFVFVLALLAVVGAPNALALAVFAAVTDALPFIGGLLGGAPVVLAALTQGPVWGIVALIAMVLYQEFESRLILPRVYSRVLRLSAAAVIVSLLVGASLLGVLGALLALPIAAALRMIFAELRLALPGEDTGHDERDLRDAAAEEVYVRLSTGASAEEASQIALDLAEELRDDDPPAHAERHQEGS
jgi:predicted PurR-regulated permease PerM